MTKLLENALQNYPRPYLTELELEHLLSGSANSRYSKVKRMIAQGKLLHIKRGFYVLTKELGYLKKPNLLELAQYIYGPSFISLESALSFHNLIPEAVYTTTSVTGKRSKEFKTPLGVFSYSRVPPESLYAEAMLFTENEQRFFIAKPWRAICDYVFCYRLNWDSLDPLAKNLRIDLHNLPYLLEEEAQSLNDYYHQRRMSLFLKGVQKDLNSNHINERNDERRNY